jgi:PHD/YefM family antitoxin component YafN of YafNO toxin-antitoxin module
MLTLDNIHSLSDFNRNSKEHIERLKESGEPEILTVNGKAELVVQDAESYQALLRKAEFADTAAAIHRGMKAHSRGEGKSMRKALESIAEEAGFELE